MGLSMQILGNPIVYSIFPAGSVVNINPTGGRSGAKVRKFLEIQWHAVFHQTGFLLGCRSCPSFLCYIDTYLSAPSASVRLSVSGFLGVLADYSVTIRYLLGRSKGCGTLDCFEAVLSNASGTSEV